MDITFEFRGSDVQSELPVQEFNVAVEKMISAPVRLVDEWIATVHLPDIRYRIVQSLYVWIMLPQVAIRRPNIGDEFARITMMKVPHRSGERNNIPKSLPASQDQLGHRKKWIKGRRSQERVSTPRLASICAGFAGADVV